MIYLNYDQTYEDNTIYTLSEILRDHATLTGVNGSNQPSTLATQERVSELEAEVQRLKTQLSKAKGINDAMWEAVVHRVISDKGNTEDIIMK